MQQQTEPPYLVQRDPSIACRRTACQGEPLALDCREMQSKRRPCMRQQISKGPVFYLSAQTLGGQQEAVSAGH